MGTSSHEAEARVRQQRALIERKVEDLESRVGDDLTAAKERLAYRVTHVTELVPGGSMLVDQAQAHPMTALTGSLGMGVALGLLTGGGDSRNHGSENGHSPSGGATGAAMGAASTLLGGLGAGVLNPLRPYMEDMAKQLIAGFAGGAQRNERPDRSDRPSASAVG
jgi:hypothetical protein